MHQCPHFYTLLSKFDDSLWINCVANIGHGLAMWAVYCQMAVILHAIFWTYIRVPITLDLSRPQNYLGCKPLNLCKVGKYDKLDTYTYGEAITLRFLVDFIFISTIAAAVHWTCILAEGQVFTHFLGRQVILEQFVDGGLQISVDKLCARFAQSDVGEEFVNVVRAKLMRRKNYDLLKL